MKNYVMSGDTITLASAARALSSGGGVLVGNLFGVASDDIASGAAGEIAVVGVYDLAKDASVFAQGDKVYWDDTAHAATSTATANKLIGVALQAQVTGDATVRVRLNETTVS